MFRFEFESLLGKEIKGFLLIFIRKVVCDKLVGRVVVRVWMRWLYIFVLVLCCVLEVGVRLWGGEFRVRYLDGLVVFLFLGYFCSKRIL